MKKTIFTLLIINVFSQPLLVNAADTVTVNFKGNIKAATCNLSAGNNIDVDLTNIGLDSFISAQGASPWKTFNIELKDCSAYINNVKLTFTGTGDNADINSLYKNSGTAANIAIQLQSGDGATPLGNTKVLTVPTNGQSLVSVPLRTRAFSSLGNGTAGTLSANITATITYL
ncbi:type 1 fimbrial protein [Providencia sp. JGM181]|jgi:minor fimbrial subunit|uniref:fimbrial protein n=1 Tax=unclassified Providencia TaxID=2633465 RepID=UPI001BA47B63|nr:MULTISPECIES: fimbrial protein [unclassified Providencia]MBS0925976.1 type 1 fimbrial protein [Providencia sp. JGM181]MBS0934153.1 type 1 fimbrial protein [Providencia sp. JGM172]MBS0998164.1 type 1 fimbrial protein [Providencia sp. JGM178]